METKGSPLILTQNMIKPLNISIIEDNKAIREGVCAFIGFQEDIEMVFATDSVKSLA